MTGDPGRDIERQDELLELLYWLEGEGFAGSATPEGLGRFLAQDGDAVERTLSLLLDRAYVVAAGAEFRLTEVGRREAARRFADEFAPLLAQGHGECNDPTCDCHTKLGGAAKCHARAQGGQRD